jgi:hypothetical protein
VVTAVYSVLSVFLIIEVASWKTFLLKIVAALLVIELIGVGLYFAGRSRAR